MRAIWTGAIGFGLVNIPVKIYSATEDSGISLDMLDKKDHAKIRFKRVNENTGKEVQWENIVKAYDFEGKYVVLSDDDFKKASPEKTKILEITQFVKQEEVDSMYYEAPYYLEPQKSGEKAYALLREALKKTGMVGLGTFVLRSKQLLGIIKPHEDVVVLNRIRFAQEIREFSDLNLPTAKGVHLKPAEVKMAEELIKQLSAPFEIEEYRDTYSDELMKLIEAKAKGKKVTAPKMKVVHHQSDDIVAQLKQSISMRRKKAS
ncbi:MAG: repair protein [Chitinophagaceae bacterium]|jgi:DNA end-binding protein Ku|nr:repair protein [Chitinophagaceae bacterium]